MRFSSDVILGGIGLGCLVLVTRAWLHLTTRFSEDGVRQLTMRGTVFIPWSDVKRVEAHRTPIVIIGNEARIELAVLLFHNTADLDPLFRRKLGADVWPHAAQGVG
jgi:hypothetical protein